MSGGELTNLHKLNRQQEIKNSSCGSIVNLDALCQPLRNEIPNQIEGKSAASRIKISNKKS